ncbi:hypothetical protein EJ07DRAFT_181527 [Lizonia empirigonia]|nr:hypothetical protein EJ07DRAFT_181527 [Lizonia empirigonia]
MGLRNISKTLLDRLTDLPAKDTFLKERVVPVKDDDKFNDNKCAHCWGEYNEEYPGVKILPCGHVFGRDYLREIVNGPTGNLCPICRVKLFRRWEVTIPGVFKLILVTLLTFWVACVDWAWQLQISIYRVILNQSFWRQVTFLLIFEGPLFWVLTFVQQCTQICSRNPKLKLRLALGGSSLIQVLSGIIAGSPFLLLTYLIIGSTGFKTVLTIHDLGESYIYQFLAWNLFLTDAFDHPADRKRVAYAAVAAMLLKELLLIWIVWYIF